MFALGCRPSHPAPRSTSGSRPTWRRKPTSPWREACSKCWPYSITWTVTCTRIRTRQVWYCTRCGPTAGSSTARSRTRTRCWTLSWAPWRRSSRPRRVVVSPATPPYWISPTWACLTTTKRRRSRRDMPRLWFRLHPAAIWWGACLFRQSLPALSASPSLASGTGRSLLYCRISGDCTQYCGCPPSDFRVHQRVSWYFARYPVIVLYFSVKTHPALLPRYIAVSSRSLVHNYIGSRYIKMDKTSWEHNYIDAILLY